MAVLEQMTLRDLKLQDRDRERVLLFGCGCGWWACGQVWERILKPCCVSRSHVQRSALPFGAVSMFKLNKQIRDACTLPPLFGIQKSVHTALFHRYIPTTLPDVYMRAGKLGIIFVLLLPERHPISMPARALVAELIGG